MKLKSFFLAILMAFMTLTASAANKMRTVFIYGFASSFNDSTVYFTEIQQLDSAYVDSKTTFLYSRENYSNQLQEYLANHGFPNATCITSFALKRKDAEKKYLKMRQRYLKDDHFTIKVINDDEFKYTAIALPKEEN